MPEQEETSEEMQKAVGRCVVWGVHPPPHTHTHFVTGWAEAIEFGSLMSALRRFSSGLFSLSLRLLPMPRLGNIWNIRLPLQGSTVVTLLNPQPGLFTRASGEPLGAHPLHRRRWACPSRPPRLLAVTSRHASMRIQCASKTWCHSPGAYGLERN